MKKRGIAKEWWIIIVLVVVILILLGAFMFGNKPIELIVFNQTIIDQNNLTDKDCNELISIIRVLINNAKKCNIDSDCILTEKILSDCCGTSEAVNKNADLTEIVNIGVLLMNKSKCSYDSKDNVIFKPSCKCKTRNVKSICENSMCVIRDKFLDNNCCSVSKISQGYECIMDCGPPIIKGDWIPTYSCLSKEDIARRTCPICLSKNTLISTDKGNIPVQEIKEGTLVWTLNKKGEKILQPVIKASSVDVKNHKIIHLILEDNREVFISPGHPTADNKTINDLKIGYVYDNSRVKSKELINYQYDKTYDLLLAGETSYYFANDILVGSTLK